MKRMLILLAYLCVCTVDVHGFSPENAGTWTRTYGGINNDGGSSVRQTFDGGYIVAGGTESFGAGNSDIYLIKTNASGMTPVEEENPERTESSYNLSQNYPNPFNSETIVQYHIPQKSWVTIKVFNMLGKEIKTLVDREEEPRDNTVRWDGKDNNNSTVPSGVYIYRIRAGDFVKSKKLILLR